jgi:uncharacterized membrane protein YbhN (UPF0104 family)
MPSKHLNLRRVFPRVWRTLFVQIAIAAASAEDPALRFTLRRTFLTHLQNRFAREFFRVFAILVIADNLSTPFRDAGKPPYSYEG